MTTELQGIFQSDIILRSAIIMAFKDLRANPYLLDYAFASLLNDGSTSKDYGAKEVARAKAWFMATDIPVVMDYHMDDIEGSSISISLVDSTEAENTLGDVHYQSTEEVEADWPALTAAFTPEAYDISTGIMTLPEEVWSRLSVSALMSVVDVTGVAHPIIEVVDPRTVVLLPGSIADFGSSVIKGQRPRLVQELESLSFKESYRLGVNAHGEPVNLTWLHSVVTFALLRYKQDLLEARGFERSVVTSAPFAKNEALGRENYWTRFISVTGFVRQSWPKDRHDRILSFSGENSSEGGLLRISKVGDVAVSFTADADELDAPWLAQDGLGTSVG